mgnify:CR=1 FL=1
MNLYGFESFEITHESVGQPNEEFWVSKDSFVSKYKSKLPLKLLPNEVFVEEQKQKPIKNIGKVAVILPVKENYIGIDEIINSYYKNCNNKFNECWYSYIQRRYGNW